MLIRADNDVGGAVAALRHALDSPDWADLTAVLNLRFLEFEDPGLARDASDQSVWEACQAAGAMLITANRAGGKTSLEATIQDLSDAASLPLITIADPQRLLRDATYRESAVFSLLDYLERRESLRGAGRLFIPWPMKCLKEPLSRTANRVGYGGSGAADLPGFWAIEATYVA